MQELVEAARGSLKAVGFRKRRNSFWRKQSGVYQLIDFQEGAHGGGYFFVNLAVHPVGLPKLVAGELSLPDQPKEYECCIRQRLEQVADSRGGKLFRQGLVWGDDLESASRVLDAVVSQGVPWLDTWGSLDRLVTASETELAPMLTSVPKLRDKSLWMLKAYCASRLGRDAAAHAALDRFLAAESGGYEFGGLNQYLSRLVEGEE